MTLLTIILVILLALLVGYSLYDIWTRKDLTTQAKLLWSLLSLITIPLGAIIYLTVGRQRHTPLVDSDLR